MTTDTSWRAGRFDRAAGPKQILFGRMYEDVEIERGAFAPGSRVFCIASAGCTAIGLSAEHDVTAVDINPVQLAYAQRRASGASRETGSAERLMQVGRRAFPLLGWSAGRLNAFLSLEDTQEQVAFWQEYLDTWSFRQAFDTATSRTVLRLTYAASFLNLMPLHIGPILRRRMERCWSQHPNRTNPYVRSLLLNDPGGDPAADDPAADDPAADDPAADDLGTDPGPARAATIRFACADAASHLESCKQGSFDAFTVSNILDGATKRYGDRLFAAVKHAASRDAVLVIRSFAEPEISSPRNQAARDRSMLWGVTDVIPVDAL